MDFEKQKWTKFLQGDKKALKELYENHVDVLFQYGLKFTNDEDLIKDEIQDLFIYLYNKRLTLRSVESPKAYLLVSFRHAMLKSIKKRSHYTNEDDYFMLDLEMSIESRMIEKEISEELKFLLAKAINKLSAREKEIVYLKYFQNLPNSEIAQFMDLNDQVTRNLISKSLKKLRSLIGDTHSLSVLLLA